MSGTLYALALTVPWQMTTEALDALLSIAAEDPMPQEEIKRRMHGPQSLALRDGQRRDDSRRMTMRDGVATIPIDGPIHRYANFFTMISGGVTTQGVARDFGIALNDPEVQAIMFVIDSPGGEATGIGELADAIAAARGVKPTSAYIEGLGASAAYRIACACDEVVMDAGALVGSIGTVMGVPDPAKMVTRSIDFVSTQSPKKRADPTSEGGKAYLQKLVDDMTEVFIGQVMRDRGLTREQVLAVEGGMLVGQLAVDAGLADRLGSEESTRRDLVERAADQAAQQGAVRPRMEEPVKISELFGSMFKAAQDAGIEIEPDEAPKQTAPAPAQQVDQATQAQISELKTQLARVQAERITSEATSFVKEQLAGGKALPAEQEQLGALFVQLAQDDVSHPVQAADGAAVSRVGLLRAAYEARPAHQLSGQLISGGAPKGSRVLEQTQSSEEELLKQAEEGARAYAQSVNSKN